MYKYCAISLSKGKQGKQMHFFLSLSRSLFYLSKLFSIVLFYSKVKMFLEETEHFWIFKNSIFLKLFVTYNLEIYEYFKEIYTEIGQLLGLQQ